VAILLLLGLTVFSARLHGDAQDVGTCAGQTVTLPFTDVPGGSLFFCAVASAYFSGLANGTSATTYAPTTTVTRDQMAAFITRTQDSAVRRSTRRAAAGQWAFPTDRALLRATTVGTAPQHVCSDGEDLWVVNGNGGTVTRVHASDGRVLGTWTGGPTAQFGAVSAAGYIYVAGYAGSATPGKILRIDPSLPAGAMTEVSGEIGPSPRSIAFDGVNLWTANGGTGPGLGSVSRYNIATDTATTFGVGFNQPIGVLFDGSRLWVLDAGDTALYRVNTATGAVADTLALPGTPGAAATCTFDGTNLWIPTGDGLTVVRASSPPTLLTTLTGNGLSSVRAVAFDGERILAGGSTLSGGVVSLWKASSLTPLGSVALADGTFATGVASDGLHFWISFSPGELLRF
jgi:hypothetical protein